MTCLRQPQAGEFVFGQVMDDFDTGQLCRQRFALATTFDRGNDFFVHIVNHGQQWLAFRLVEHRQLRRIRVNGLLGLAIEHLVTQQLDLLFQVDNVGRISLLDLLLAHTGSLTLKQHLLEQSGIIGEVVGQMKS